MSEHTPGPRTIDDSGNVFGPNGRLVANFGSWNDGNFCNRSENMANARHDAAAPKLLEACEATLGLLTSQTTGYLGRNERGDPVYESEYIDAVVSQLQAAIAETSKPESKT